MPSRRVSGFLGRRRANRPILGWRRGEDAKYLANLGCGVRYSTSAKGRSYRTVLAVLLYVLSCAVLSIAKTSCQLTGPRHIWSLRRYSSPLGRNAERRGLFGLRRSAMPLLPASREFFLCRFATARAGGRPVLWYLCCLCSRSPTCPSAPPERTFILVATNCVPRNEEWCSHVAPRNGMQSCCRRRGRADGDLRRRGGHGRVHLASPVGSPRVGSHAAVAGDCPAGRCCTMGCTVRSMYMLGAFAGNCWELGTGNGPSQLDTLEWTPWDRWRGGREILLLGAGCMDSARVEVFSSCFCASVRSSCSFS